MIKESLAITDEVKYLDQHTLDRIASLEEIIEMLIKGMEKQNATIGAFEARLNSLELSRKKEPKILIN